MTPAPPYLLRRLLAIALPSGLRGDTILGDLDEEFRQRARRGSISSATAWYWRTSLGVIAHVGVDRWRRAHRSTAALPRSRASFMDTLIQDVRQGLRTLRGAKRFTAAALATLALGIGAATAIFSIVNAMLLRPLPYPESAQLMWASESKTTGATITISWPNYLDWQRIATSFEALAASRSGTFTLTGAGEAVRLDGRQVTSNFLHVLRVAPAIGRDFTVDDDRPSPVHPIIISDGFWRTTLGRDPQILGRRITIDGSPHEIVGVMPPGFRYVLDYAFFEPIGILTDDASFLNRGNHQGLFALGRLRPGVSEASARQELEAIAAALAQQYAGTNTGQSAHLEPLASRLIGDLKPALIVLISAVGLLLLVACANVASLLVAHGVTRRQELALRSALGANRPRLIRQLLVESSLLSLAGGTLGVLTGWGLLRALVSVAPPTLARLDEVRLDGPALLCALAVTVVSGLLFGVFPAVMASASNGQHLVVRSGRGGTAATHRLRRGLLVTEVALALVILCGAGLTIRTMWRLTTADVGFSPNHLLTLKYSIRNSDWTDDRTLAFHDEVLRRTRLLPGVSSAGFTMSLPIEGSQWGSVFIVGDRPVPARADVPSSAFTPVSPDYFETLGLHLIAGRVFTAGDRASVPDVAIVNERFAKRFWPNESPIGKRLKQGWPDSATPWREIVGVVNDIKLEGVESPTPMQVYLPIAQEPLRSVVMLVRTDVTAAATAASIRAIVGELDPNIPVYDVRTMDDVMGLRIGRRTLTMTIFAVFGVMALLLAAVGLYGVVSQGVADRTREIGVRMALGATGRQVLTLFVRQGAVTTGIGIAAGTAASLLLSRFMTDMLFEIPPNDPPTIAGVIVLLLSVSIAACYLPARRATKVSPTIALRGE